MKKKVTYKMLADYMCIKKNTLYHYSDIKRMLLLEGYLSLINKKLVRDPREV